jgi:hypothetical protein
MTEPEILRKAMDIIWPPGSPIPDTNILKTFNEINKIFLKKLDEHKKEAVTDKTLDAAGFENKALGQRDPLANPEEQ